MPCSTKVFLYYDLEGKPTGGYRVECAGGCKEGECGVVVNKDRLLRSIRVYCACQDAKEKELPREGCSMELLIEMVADGRVILTPVCCPKPCGKCKECRVVSRGRKKVIDNAESGRPQVRLEEEFGCECKPIETAALRAFYKDKICRLVAFALKNGIEISAKDLYHAHVITDVNPPCRDKNGGLILDEQFMMEHYRGLLAHAHEYDGLRSTTEDNFNIVVEENGDVHFAGSTKVLVANDPLVPQGPQPEQIHFRLCKPSKDCPDCITKIFCPSINKDLCVGLRRRFPAKDPALGRP